VIVGGGFGGLYARVRWLRSCKCTLSDRRNYHSSSPCLFRWATGLLSGRRIAEHWRSILSRQGNAEVSLDEVMSLMCRRGMSTVSRMMSIRFDSGTGIQYNSFVMMSGSEIAPGLAVALKDADKISGKYFSF